MTGACWPKVGPVQGGQIHSPALPDLSLPLPTISCPSPHLDPSLMPPDLPTWPSTSSSPYYLLPPAPTSPAQAPAWIPGTLFAVQPVPTSLG